MRILALAWRVKVADAGVVPAVATGPDQDLCCVSVAGLSLPRRKTNCTMRDAKLGRSGVEASVWALTLLGRVLWLTSRDAD